MPKGSAHGSRLSWPGQRLRRMIAEPAQRWRRRTRRLLSRLCRGMPVLLPVVGVAVLLFAAQDPRTAGGLGTAVPISAGPSSPTEGGASPRWPWDVETPAPIREPDAVDQRPYVGFRDLPDLVPPADSKEGPADRVEAPGERMNSGGSGVVVTAVPVLVGSVAIVAGALAVRRRRSPKPRSDQWAEEPKPVRSAAPVPTGRLEAGAEPVTAMNAGDATMRDRGVGGGPNDGQSEEQPGAGQAAGAEAGDGTAAGPVSAGTGGSSPPPDARPGRAPTDPVRPSGFSRDDHGSSEATSGRSRAGERSSRVVLFEKTRGTPW